jgi:hypothetical protein
MTGHTFVITVDGQPTGERFVAGSRADLDRSLREYTRQRRLEREQVGALPVEEALPRQPVS